MLLFLPFVAFIRLRLKTSLATSMLTDHLSQMQTVPYIVWLTLVLFIYQWFTKSAKGNWNTKHCIDHPLAYKTCPIMLRNSNFLSKIVFTLIPFTHWRIISSIIIHSNFFHSINFILLIYLTIFEVYFICIVNIRHYCISVLFSCILTVLYNNGTAAAQWLRYCATNRKVAGSIPDGVIGIFHWHNPSDHTMTLGLTQPLTEMSTRSISWE
jgi:hypothetical protein